MEATNQGQLITFLDTIHQQQDPTPKSGLKATPSNGDPAPALGVPQVEPRRSPRLNPGLSAAAINPDTGKQAEY